jgi:integrase
MPRHKIKREEEIPTCNWKKIIELAEKIDYSNAQQVPPLQLWLSCVLALDWLFGKRINEILKLRRKNITFTATLIKVRFRVGKKRSKGSPIEMQPFQKSRSINHLAVPYIKKYLAEYDEKIGDPEGYLFPAETKSRTRVVHTTFTNSKGEKETREYVYNDKGGYVFEENARFWLKKINMQLPEEERIYFHYGRHNIGIKLAYQGKSDIVIAKILDESPRAALTYTKHAGGIDEEWTHETE